MITKRKFKFKKRDLMDEAFAEILSFLEKILEDYKEYLSPSFKVVTDIDLGNLKEFLVFLLRALSEDRISINKIEEVGDALETYIHRRYLSDFPDTGYPNFGNEHPLSVSLNIIEFLSSPSYVLFPEDAAFFIEMLQAPPEKALETNQKMCNFVEQFDTDKRYQEGEKRGLFDKW